MDTIIETIETIKNYCTSAISEVDALTNKLIQYLENEVNLTPDELEKALKLPIIDQLPIDISMFYDITNKRFCTAPVEISGEHSAKPVSNLFLVPNTGQLVKMADDKKIPNDLMKYFGGKDINGYPPSVIQIDEGQIVKFDDGRTFIVIYSGINNYSCEGFNYDE